LIWFCSLAEPGTDVAERKQFTAEKRAIYLGALRRSGSHRAAAREAEISERTARKRRAREPAFEAACREALEASQGRLAERREAGEGGARNDLESIRRGADGRLKIQARGSRRWSLAAEERFFSVLRESGNIAGSARAAGVSREAVWKRRREWPAFARRMEEVLEEAAITLEFRVACLGTNWPDGAEAGEGVEAEVEAGPPSTELRTGFDPELALRFLKWREEKRRGRPGVAAALPPVEEVRERIIRKVEAIKRHREREEKRAEEGEE
jgi:hypothetical protein